MSQFDQLQEMALHPGDWGESVKITMLQDGGMALEPLDDEARTLVLDNDQVHALRVRLAMDPKMASDQAAVMMLAEWYDRDSDGTGLIAFIVGALFGLVIGFALGALIF